MLQFIALYSVLNEVLTASEKRVGREELPCRPLCFSPGSLMVCSASDERRVWCCKGCSGKVSSKDCMGALSLEVSQPAMPARKTDRL
jgi:hypothetical protein